MSADVVTFAPARRRLRRIDPADAAAGNRVLALLDGLSVDDPQGVLTLSVRGAASPRDGGWLVFDTGAGEIAISALVIAGQPVPPLAEGVSPDLPAALHQLSRLEPIIGAVERAVGLPLDPVAVGPQRGLAFDVQARDADGAIVHTAQLSVDPTCAAVWPDPPPTVDFEAHAAATLRASLEGPRAPLAELPLLASGDVVVLPTASGGLACTLSGADAPILRGRLDVAARRLTLQHVETDPMLDTAQRPAESRAPDHDTSKPVPPAEGASFAPRAEAPAQPLSTEGLTIRLGVELGEVRLSLKALSGLKPGSVIALPLEGDDLVVELNADGQPLATGRLVSLGDAYGVLVDSVRAG